MRASFIARQGLLAAGLWLLAGGAWAEAQPYTFSVAETLTHDSNVQRAEAGAAVADVYSSTDFKFAVDQPFGRQRFLGDVTLQVNRFREQSELNNQSPSAHVELDWSAANRWEGELGGNYKRQLIRYDLFASEPVTGRNLQTSTDAFARGRVGVVTEWTLEGALLANRREFSQSLYDGQEMNRRAAELGVRYSPQPDLVARALVRRAVGRYPHYSDALGADNFDRNDLESTLALRLSGATLLDFRLTYSDESHSQQTSRSNHAWTGAAGAQWQPTGKLSFALRWSRDSDTGSQGFETGQTSTDTRLSDRLEMATTWRVTEKVQAEFRFQQTLRNLGRETDGAADAVTGRDRQRQISVGLAYSPIRALTTGCSATDERRKVSGSLDLSYPYTAFTVTCFGRFAWH